MTGSDSDCDTDLSHLPSGRHAAQHEDDSSYYEKGNCSSRLFFARMQASHSEAHSIKKQCAAAASASPARRNEERMNLDLLRLNIGSARRSSEVAKNAVMLKGSCRQELGQQPKDLGHLSLPTQSRDNLGLVETAFVLPGALESSKVREDTVRDLTQPFITGIRSTSADFEILERAAEKYPQRLSTETGLLAALSARSPLSQTSPTTRRNSKRLSSKQSRSGSKQSGGGRGGPRSSSKFLSTNWAVVEAGGDPDLDVSINRPALRFKFLTQFNERFQPESAAQEKAVIHQTVMEQNKLLKSEPDEKIYHQVLGWTSHELALTIETKDQLEVAFPIIVLTMLDAVYAKRVRWTEVDWDVRYVRATAKNYVVLQALWKETNMDSSAVFRKLPTFLRLEAMYKAPSQDRLTFLTLMQRWFTQRMPDSDPYNAMGRRRQYYEQCKLWGRPIEFPSWANFDPAEEEEDAGEGEMRLIRKRSLAAAPERGYIRMPEFQRLRNFLGNEQVPSM
mmetsp:Transcript_33845/g.66591  ORF Transcript_33845/g.66591 Transcript_33845/m.66591 type:complete len:506 (-) Transcript_33845:233-1750(-)